MRSRIVSRRGFLNEAAFVALAIAVYGCEKSVTKYHPDGTPYTEKEEDWVGTVAVALLLIVALAIIGSNNNDSSRLDAEDDWQDPKADGGKFRFVSMGIKGALPLGGSVEEISVTDSEGRLLITVDAFERVEHKNLEAAESLLASAQISNLEEPIAVHLKQDRLDLYRVEHIHFLKEPSSGRFTLFNRQINGKPYMIKVFTRSGNTVDIEIVPRLRGSRSVA